MLAGHGLCREGTDMSSDRAQPGVLKLPETSVQPSLWPYFLPCVGVDSLGDVGLRTWPSLPHSYNSPQQRTCGICAHCSSATTKMKTPPTMRQNELSSVFGFSSTKWCELWANHLLSKSWFSHW